MLFNLLNRLKTEQTGFSLIEVLAAILIIAVAITPLYYVFTYNSLVIADSGRRTQAVLYAQELMERLKANPHSLGLATGEYDASNLDQLGIVEAPPVGLVPLVTIAWENQSLGLYRVTVKVQWQLRKVREVELTTLLFSR
ncbi:MAG: prepilin-type N-terminal cleavage/methylation domain-containing protein [Syntrophomonadaceae bacterium]|nr:prepilin-type N-terminal cleavage/methylation domain-containing protein [Syntrophomonadaceae bacterium]